MYCLGLEIHLLGKFTSYILLLWYHLYHNVKKWVSYSHMKIWQQIAGYNVEMGKIATKIKPMPLWISSPKQWFKWLSEMSTILHPLKITLFISPSILWWSWPRLSSVTGLVVLLLLRVLLLVCHGPYPVQQHGPGGGGDHDGGRVPAPGKPVPLLQLLLLLPLDLPVAGRPVA